MNKLLTFVLFLAANTLAFGQNVKGIIVNENNEPWAFASLLWKGTQIGTTTDENGNFSLPHREKGEVIISHLAFETDTIEVPHPHPENWIITIASGVELEAFDVVDKSGGTRINKLDPKNIEVLGEAELTKAACCNLSEAFETNASVDVSSSDAATGLKEIYLLGLSGNNILFTQENMPDMQGIDRPFGLMSIPGPWLSEIAIAKGVSSVSNASEGLAGQINYCESKFDENWGMLNVYTNAFGRKEGNLGFGVNTEGGVSHRLQLHGSERKGLRDNNDDNFYDVPEMESLALSYTVEKETEKWHRNFFVRTSKHTIKSGLSDDFSGTDFKSRFSHQRTKFGGKWGFKSTTPGVSTGIQAFFKNSHSHGYNYGKTYSFFENRLFVNAIHQRYLGNSDYTLKSGLNYVYLEQHGSFNPVRIKNYPSEFDFPISTNEGTLHLPALFSELDATMSDKWSGTFGLRYLVFPDAAETGFTPRFNLRYKINDDFVVKGVIGKTARIFNPLTENLKYFSSSQEIEMGVMNLWENRLETGLNMGVNTVRTFVAESGMETEVSAEFYFSTFENYNVAYVDDVNRIRFTQKSTGNYFGFGSEKHTTNFLTQVKQNITENFDARLGYRYVNAIRPDFSGSTSEWFVPKHRGFLNLAYHFSPAEEREWKFDLTLHALDEQPLPSAWYDTANSPAYVLANAQINYVVGEVEFYIGSENIGNYRIPNPIITTTNSSGEIQDAMAYGAWGPVAGRNVYIGLTWKPRR